MGEQIRSDEFSEADFRRFRERLDDQLQQLRGIVGQPGFGAGEPSIGVEVELSLVDARARPADCNEEVAAAVQGRGVSVELNRFSGEYDSRPVPLAGRPFAALATDLRAGLGDVAAAAKAFGARVALAGTLPTLIRADLLDPAVMTPRPRYRALAAALTAGKPDEDIRIEGRERLHTTIPGVVAEGANNALQVHLRVRHDRFAATLDAAHLVSAPVLALAANSPYFLSRRLWDDTRIPLFAQAISGSTAPLARQRVFLAHGWTGADDVATFTEDVARCRPILPVLYEPQPDVHPPPLRELRLHTGSIWRWNRPVYDATGAGHLRIELRCLPTGPTVADMVGNAALIVGAALARADTPVADQIGFPAVRDNLAAAARDGLDAVLAWPAEQGGPPAPRPVRDILAELLPAAQDALVGAGVAADDADRALAPVRARLRRATSGARWQTATAERLESGRDRVSALAEMLQRMLHYGHDGPPVADWD